MAGTRSNATDVRDSIEAKGGKAEDVEMKDARDEEEDADGEPDAEGEEDDADGDGDDDDEDADMDDDDPANFRQLIDKLQTFLSSYEENGEELASGFQRIPNKRVLPDYFTVIDTPVAFSTHKLQKKLYTGFTEFVRDVAQICHNAQVYNRPSAPIFGAAERLRAVFKEELAKLVAKGTIKPEEAVLPDLGELPPADESPEPEADEEDEEEEEDEDEEEEEEDDSDDEGRRRRSRKGRHTAKHDDDPYRKRGRPPKLLTPTEARIDAVLRGLRKVKDDDGDLIIADFEKLPDKTEYPEYYETIQQPVAIEGIKRKMKRKQYNSVDHALLDLDLMFNNAQQFNEDGSEIFENAVRLQAEARRLVAEQKARPDDDFRDDDGKLPLSEIWHRAEKYQVGDWVHIKNGNPDNKPIVAQIFRTWQDRDGKRMINACWYYHPEQTVHRFDKHFYEHEVAKSGQYRDHPIESVIEKCFVMFHTRFFKGRPRGFPPNKSVYVCESRYNEDQRCFRKIKTWASCVPDEVRSRDYEMDMFPVPLSNVKVPSPIKHLVRSDATETSELPKPTWGDKHSPPIVGAAHRRPRDPKDSPPPTHHPQPAANPPYFDPSRRQSFHQGGRPNEMMMSQSPARSYVGMPGQMPHGGPSPSPGPYQQQQGYASASPVAHHSMPSHPQQQMGMQQMQPSPRPYYNQQRLQPMQQAGYQQTFQAQPPPFQAPPQQHQQPPQHMIQPYQQQHQQMPPQQHPQAPQQHHQRMYAQTPVGIAPQQQMHSHGANPAQPNFDPRMNINAGRNTMASTPVGNPAPQANVFRGPEVYTLADQANDAIPAEIRERFHRDEHNKVIFFTVPPDAPPSSGLSHESEGLGHSARYLANRDKYLARKQQRRDELGAKKNIAELRRAANMPEGQEREDEINRIVEGIVAGLTEWTASHTKETERLFKQLGVSTTRIASAQSN
ncbi:hypothetical protein F5X68DRAFT_176476 [Plectosphaerella plurivora]|uniref:Uncharacterized protein n=1 Tax=Plectosphaerella plurivora TaxID=936078 RepID=A0A9P8V3S8_9PEZI|nr:hypothetical protein F5X68DRAFT_176476 [Plectosphaerella plurivora]